MLIALSLALTAAEPAAPPRNEIVVTGRSLKALGDDLQRCIDAHCPPREDVIASVRYAEGLFRSAQYQDSRRVLQKAITRDKSAAKADPYAVAALYEATMTVAQHEGEQNVVASATNARARMLHDALPDTAPEVLRADLDVADLTFRRGSATQAEDSYRTIAARAASAHQPGIAAGATLRRAQVEHAMGNDLTAGRLLDGVIGTGPELASGYRLAAYAMKARLHRARGDTTATDALRAELARSPQPRPLLLSAPRTPPVADVANLDFYNNVDRTSQSGDLISLAWADIGFTIRPDGTVEMPEKLRGTLGTNEVNVIAKSLQQRVYAAFTPDAGVQYRIERWTLTADYETPVGSLIARRSRNPHYETLDITTGDPPAAKAAAS